MASSSPTFTDCEFSANTATAGAGMFCYNGSSPTLDGANITGTSVNADNVIIDKLSGATYGNLKDYINNIQSGGLIADGAITDNEDGSVTVAAGKGICKTCCAFRECR